MLLARLSLHNFKIFEGTHHLDLSVDKNSSTKNIILIGGLNGAGKTSLLEAVKLCLYGKENRDLWTSKESYNSYIVELLNKHIARKGYEHEMWVELDFDGVVIKGIEHQMTIRRRWRINPRANELLELDRPEILIDDKPFEFIEEEYWQDFIRDFIPPGVSKFFFFDGEKIQTIAEELDYKELKTSIQDVLGLNIYETLEKDLKFHSDKLRRDSDKVSAAELKELEAHISRAEEEISRLEERRETLEDDIRKLQHENNDIELEIKRIAGVMITSLDDARAQLQEIERQLEQVNADIVKISGDLLPFAIAGGLCIDLKQRLSAEDKLAKWQASKALVEPKIKTIIEGVFGDHAPRPTPDITHEQRTFYRKRVEDLMSTLFEPKPADAADFALHDLSQRERELILNTLESISSTLANTLKDLSREREQLIFTRDKLQRELQKAPEDSRSKELLQNKDKNLEAIGSKRKEIDQLSENIDKLRRDITSLQKQKADVNARLEEAEVQRKKVDLAKRIQVVLREYAMELKKRKIDELEKHITEMYRMLARKGDLVVNIDIDPETFDVNLHNSDGEIINKRNLSAGEKQIYAVSLLWGLAKASDKELPIIIDTPFGRLDSVHRHNIVSNYFPNASRQVIILSTDTEVRGENFALIRPYIQKSYRLEYDKKRNYSEIVEGYFPD